MSENDFQKELARRRTLELQARRLLGVAPTDGPARIRRAFRRAARRLHPDRRPTDPEATRRFQRLVAAYQLLIDGVEPSIDLSPEAEQTQEPPPEGRYRRNPWGYFAWWRDSFMSNELEREEEEED